MDIMAVTDTIWGVLVGLGTSPVIFIFIFPRAFVLTLALILALILALHFFRNFPSVYADIKNWGGVTAILPQLQKKVCYFLGKLI